MDINNIDDVKELKALKAKIGAIKAKKAKPAKKDHAALFNLIKDDQTAILGQMVARFVLLLNIWNAMSTDCLLLLKHLLMQDLELYPSVVKLRPKL